MTSNNSHERYINIDGCYNMRDVGGYATRDGLQTRWKMLWRSDSLHRLTAQGWRTLHEHGIKTLIDLRRPAETRSAGYQPIAPSRAECRHMPIFDDVAYAVVDEPARDLADMYRLLLDNCSAQFAAVQRVIASHEQQPVLVHCAVGKDRTGLTIALALGIAGVPDETIAEDYSHSYRRLAPLHEVFRSNERARGGDMARFERMLFSPYETMIETLGYLRERYDGAAGYLRRAGMSDQELATLRATLVEGLR